MIGAKPPAAAGDAAGRRCPMPLGPAEPADLHAALGSLMTRKSGCRYCRRLAGMVNARQFLPSGATPSRRPDHKPIDLTCVFRRAASWQGSGEDACVKRKPLHASPVASSPWRSSSARSCRARRSPGRASRTSSTSRACATNMLVGYGLVVGLNGTGDSLKQRALHPAEPAVDAGAPGRQHPRRHAEHQERGRGDGHRQAAGLRRRRRARSTSPSRPWATPRACWAAPCWSPPLLGADGAGLCGGPGHGADRRASRPQAPRASAVTRGVPTAGRIANGAIVERETGFQLASMAMLRLTLRNPDFTTVAPHRRRDQRAIPRLRPRPTTRPSSPVKPPAGQRHGRASSPTSSSSTSSPIARQGGDRRGVGRDRDGRGRAHLHGRHRPGQPDHHGHGDAAGQPARAVQPGHDHGRSRSRRSRSTRTRASS